MRYKTLREYLIYRINKKREALQFEDSKENKSYERCLKLETQIEEHENLLSMIPKEFLD